MTTATYKNGIMASDSAISYGSMVLRSQPKILRLSRGLYAYCGMVSTSLKLAKFIDKNGLENLKDVDLNDNDFGAIIWWDNRLYEIDCELYPQELSPKQYHAIGSGAAYAMAAMECGKDAVEAVQIACKFDKGSREPVHYDFVLGKDANISFSDFLTE